MTDDRHEVPRRLWALVSAAAMFSDDEVARVGVGFAERMRALGMDDVAARAEHGVIQRMLKMVERDDDR